MTHIIHDGAPGRPTSFASRLAGLITTYRREARRRWIARVTEKAIAELSPQMRKDIGWPTRYDC